MGRFPRTGVNEKEALLFREVEWEERGPVWNEVAGNQSSRLVEKPMRDMEDVDPGEPPDFTVALFLRPSITPKGVLPPGLQPQDRFLV